MFQDLKLVCGSKLESFLNFTIANHDKDYKKLNTRLIYNIKNPDIRNLLNHMEPRLAQFLLKLSRYEDDDLVETVSDLSINSNQSTICGDFIFKPKIASLSDFENEFIYKPKLFDSSINPSDEEVRLQSSKVSKVLSNEDVTDWLSISKIPAKVIESNKSTDILKVDIFTAIGYSKAYEKYSASQIIGDCAIISEQELITKVIYMLQGISSDIFHNEMNTFKVARLVRVESVGIISTMNYCKRFVKYANLMLDLKWFVIYFKKLGYIGTALGISLGEILSNFENNIETVFRNHKFKAFKLVELGLSLGPLFETLQDLHFVLNVVQKNENSGSILPILYSKLLEFQFRNENSLGLLLKLFRDAIQPFLTWVEKWLEIDSKTDLIYPEFECQDPYQEFFICKNSRNDFIVIFD